MADQAQVDEARTALLNHVLNALGEPPQPSGAFDLSPYLDLLPSDGARGELGAILTTLAPPGKDSGTRAAWARQPLQLDRNVIMPGQRAQTGNWRSAFRQDWQMLQDPVGQFEVAAEVFRKHTWCVPGTRGEPGVSLYEEFKLLAALVHASGCEEQPAGSFTLVTGDFPGIQRTIYTITSKGAAKGLRGRSFFLQLLGDGVVRRLLAELDLPWLNVVYVAGGNFVILAKSGVEQTVTDCASEINMNLLDSFQGDIALCMACEAIGAEELHGEAFNQRWRSLKKALAQAKLRPFAEQAVGNWNGVFSPQGAGTDRHCVVCHYDPPDERNLHRYGDDWWCEECEGFDELASALAANTTYLSIANWPEDRGEHWQNRLFAITGQWYDLHSTPPQDGRPFFKLNSTDFLRDEAWGFRFVATLTPLDRNGNIRDFDQLAKLAEGFARIGVLRMDVDNLGRIFREYIQQSSLTRISAASFAMSLFFDGWLNEVCRSFETAVNRPDSLYVIYAGGDDLFVVGPWDMMPELAQRVHDDLRDYANSNPSITISAGIAVVDPKYPLYQAASLALDALDGKAKEHPGKNAICFLDEVVGWEDEWPQVIQQREKLISLVEGGMPKALVQTVRRVHAQWEEGRKRAEKKGITDPNQINYGRWMWMQEYSLTRLAERSKNGPQARRHIRELQQSTLSPDTIRLAGLSARWVDYLKRSKQGD